MAQDTFQFFINKIKGRVGYYSEEEFDSRIFEKGKIIFAVM